MIETLHHAVARYGELKLALMSTGASEDLLHVHAGMLIFVLAALVQRKRMRSPMPLALVAFFAALNELVDHLAGTPQGAWEPVVDFANTVFWPTVLFLIARRGR